MGKVFWSVMLVVVVVFVLRAFTIESENKAAKAEFDDRAAKEAWKLCPKKHFAADKRLNELVRIQVLGGREFVAADGEHVLAAMREAAPACGINKLQTATVFRDWNGDEIRRVRIETDRWDLPEAERKAFAERFNRLQQLVSDAWKGGKMQEAES